MKLNALANWLPQAIRWVVTSCLCVLTIAFVWQGTAFDNSAALAAPITIAARDAGDQVKAKTYEDTGRAKNFVRDTTEKLKDTANSNAEKVERATEGKGGFFARKANRDAARIEQRAEQDANRTQKAIDNTRKTVRNTVDNIKDAID